MTRIADRDARTIWEKKGSTDIHTRAMNRAREIMANHTEPMISSEMEEQLRREFPGMVSGNLLPFQAD